MQEGIPGFGVVVQGKWGWEMEGAITWRRWLSSCQLHTHEFSGAHNNKPEFPSSDSVMLILSESRYKFQISNCYKWKNNKQFAAIGICWCYKTRETYIVEMLKSVFYKTHVHSEKVYDCRSTIKTNQTSKLVHYCQPQSPLQATRVWPELQTGLLL